MTITELVVPVWCIYMSSMVDIYTQHGGHIYPAWCIYISTIQVLNKMSIYNSSY